MHPHIHVRIIIYVQKENHNMSCIIKSSIILHKIIKNHLKKIQDIHAMFVDTSKAKFRFSFYTLRPFARQWSLISYVTSRPSASNGHRSLYIKTLCKAMVIDFLCHIEAICEAMVINFFRIGTLYMVMVIESFRYRPSPRDWSNIFFKKSKYKKNMVCQIVTLYKVMVTKSFGYRPSPRDWSNLFSKKYRKKKIFKSRPFTW